MGSAREMTLFKLAEIAIWRLFESGKIIIDTGAEVSHLYLINKGVCQVTKNVAFPERYYINILEFVYDN